MREHSPMSFLSPVLLETELAELYQQKRLEPGCTDPSISSAISLKRIADALEGTPLEKLDSVQLDLIGKLKDRHNMLFSDALKIAMKYFKRILE